MKKEELAKEIRKSTRDIGRTTRKHSSQQKREGCVSKEKVGTYIKLLRGLKG